MEYKEITERIQELDYLIIEVNREIKEHDDAEMKAPDSELESMWKEGEELEERRQAYEDERSELLSKIAPCGDDEWKDINRDRKEWADFRGDNDSRYDNLD